MFTGYKHAVGIKPSFQHQKWNVFLFTNPKTVETAHSVTDTFRTELNCRVNGQEKEISFPSVCRWVVKLGEEEKLFSRQT